MDIEMNPSSLMNDLDRWIGSLHGVMSSVSVCLLYFQWVYIHTSIIMDTQWLGFYLPYDYLWLLI